MAVRGADVTIRLRDPFKVNEVEVFLAATRLHLGPLQDLLLTRWLADRQFVMSVATTPSKEVATDLAAHTMTMVVTETIAKAITAIMAWHGLKTSAMPLVAGVKAIMTGTEAETENPGSLAVTSIVHQVVMYHRWTIEICPEKEMGHLQLASISPRQNCVTNGCGLAAAAKVTAVGTHMEKANCAPTLASSHLAPQINKHRLANATEELVAAIPCPILVAGCLLHQRT